MGRKRNHQVNRGSRQDDTRTRNQGKPHARGRIATLSAVPPFAVHVQGLDIETRKAIVDILRWDMNAVSRWVRAQEDAFPKQFCTASQIGLAEGLTLVKTLLIDVELVLARLQRGTEHKS